MSKKNIAEQESKIKESLFEFLKTHIAEADINLIDEIVLSYVIAVLEDVGTEPVFDIEVAITAASLFIPGPGGVATSR
ncbi:unnamed protein product [Callosobruchus maculatus]|uniref:Uncharacterized protein n=1 Tax=Callosobruchus maculatus TaxID=64391 RepID=A0A653BDR5_CALMS|nr:unnamed protein product [Callosobruchus maculatus]